MKRTVSALLFLLCAVLPGGLYAAGEPHEEVFGEDELIVGIKGGLQLSGLTAATVDGNIVNYQSAAKLLGGVATKWVYGPVRIEVDVFWNSRRGTSPDSTAISFAFPVVLQFPIHLAEGTELELGFGAQADYIRSGGGPNPHWLLGPLASAAVIFDLGWSNLDLGARYYHGVEGLSERVSGAEPRDLQGLIGLLWRI